jgi:uncharacterized protein (TIGR02996 family)
VLGEEKELLQTCARIPDDDVPRLLLADWYDDHKQPEKAEFIRLQVSAARVESGDDSDGLADLRAATILNGNREEWEREPKRFGVKEIWYDRGLPCQICVPAPELAKYAQEILDLCPTVSAFDFGNVNVTARHLKVILAAIETGV